MNQTATKPAITLDKILYTASATATGGRSGRVSTDDGSLTLETVVPRDLGGSTDAHGTNPEQLFAAGYAACFGSALELVARKQRVETGPVAITAKVHLGPVGRAYGLGVELACHLPELDRDLALALVRAAHEVCPYSNATRGNIAVDLRLV